MTRFDCWCLCETFFFVCSLFFLSPVKLFKFEAELFIYLFIFVLQAQSALPENANVVFLKVDVDDANVSVFSLFLFL